MYDINIQITCFWEKNGVKYIRTYSITFLKEGKIYERKDD